jgi:serine/threonine-protein kinase
MGSKQRYQVIQKLDSGGMAEVFKGRALSLDGIEKPVAIKRILPSLSDNSKFVKMFIDEARLSMRLTHANIVQVFDVGRADGTYFLVMELVDGTNARRLFQKASEAGRRIPASAVAYLGMEVCKALNHAHELRDDQGASLGIVHRDVSPPNILISWSGEVKITDFGLAKAVSQIERTDPGVVKGKFSYMSPEAVDGKTVDARADIFGLGVILHELLTGRRLFMGRNDLETVELLRKCQVPAPSTINNEVPKDLDEIVLKALARDRKKRWQSAKDLGDALAQFLFTQGQKFTQFDLASLVKSIHEEKGVTEDYSGRLRELIRDEVLSLSMIGVLPSPFPAGRAEPLNPEELDERKGVLEEYWDDYAANPSAGAGSDFDRLVQSVSGPLEQPKPEKKPLVNGTVGLIIFILLLVLLGGFALLYLSGQLDAILAGEAPDFGALFSLFQQQE